jgi:hypothetical protein
MWPQWYYQYTSNQRLCFDGDKESYSIWALTLLVTIAFVFSWMFSPLLFLPDEGCGKSKPV